MQINFKDLAKEQIVFIILPIILLAFGIAGIVQFGMDANEKFKEMTTKTQELESKEQEKQSLEVKLSEIKKEEESPDAKKIYTLEGMRFGTGASFAPLFDDMIAIAKGAGIRIRSVDYNYSPTGDPIFDAKPQGVNVCELSTTIVGKYSEIQAFLKTLLSEPYLVNIAQVEIVSWQRDKSVLIANLKIRYYTKT